MERRGFMSSPAFMSSLLDSSDSVEHMRPTQNDQPAAHPLEVLGMNDLVLEVSSSSGSYHVAHPAMPPGDTDGR